MGKFAELPASQRIPAAVRAAAGGYRMARDQPRQLRHLLVGGDDGDRPGQRGRVPAHRGEPAGQLAERGGGRDGGRGPGQEAAGGQEGVEDEFRRPGQHTQVAQS